MKARVSFFCNASSYRIPVSRKYIQDILTRWLTTGQGEVIDESTLHQPHTVEYVNESYDRRAENVFHGEFIDLQVSINNIQNMNRNCWIIESYSLQKACYRQMLVLAVDTRWATVISNYFVRICFIYFDIKYIGQLLWHAPWLPAGFRCGGRSVDRWRSKRWL